MIIHPNISVLLSTHFVNYSFVFGVVEYINPMRNSYGFIYFVMISVPLHLNF